jgi:hypothetical protein
MLEARSGAFLGLVPAWTPAAPAAQDPPGFHLPAAPSPPTPLPPAARPALDALMAQWGSGQSTDPSGEYAGEWADPPGTTPAGDPGASRSDDELFEAHLPRGDAAVPADARALDAVLGQLAAAPPVGLAADAGHAPPAPASAAPATPPPVAVNGRPREGGASGRRILFPLAAVLLGALSAGRRIEGGREPEERRGRQDPGPSRP